MAKVTITMTIDVPDSENYSDGELSQLLFDEVVNYATVTHLSDAVDWLTQSLGKQDSSEAIISEHHRTWGNIMKDCEWSFERKTEDG